ncbi:hypothetical protein NYE86_01275 [Actinacidiphila bryophytorum]|nr:hypothetical protein NYE86_01275 [Actinacidiphila bryophytorum]
MVSRLLPWSGEGGKPSYLVGGADGSYLSRLADNLEALQLGMAEALDSHVDALMSDQALSDVELRSVVSSLQQALRDVHRVAVSRGGRLPVVEDDELSARAAAVVDREVLR